MTRIRAITFDVGGTLIEPWPSVGHVYAGVAAEFGITCAPDQLNSGFARAWRSRSGFGYTRAEWLDLVQQSLSQLGEVTPALFGAIYDRFAESQCWRVFDDVRPALDGLKSAGMRLAVISNWDERLVPLLERLELAPYFEATFVSTAVGAHKPAREIFCKAAYHFDLPPNQILHVGDSEMEDVRGAIAAGFQARRIRREGVVEPFDIPSLTGIPHDVLG